MDYTVYQLLWLFLFYSFLGWLAETVLAAAETPPPPQPRLPQRPLLSHLWPGGAAFAIFLPELREDPFFLFLLGMILATFLEFVTRCIPGAHLSSEMVGLFRPAVSV